MKKIRRHLVITSNIKDQYKRATSMSAYKLCQGIDVDGEYLSWGSSFPNCLSCEN